MSQQTDRQTDDRQTDASSWTKTTLRAELRIEIFSPRLNKLMLRSLLSTNTSFSFLLLVVDANDSEEEDED